MSRDTWVQSQVASYQRFLKWYLIPPCLTLSNIRYVSRVKWSNPRKGVAPFPTPRCSSYWKGSLLVALDYSRQIYYLLRNRIEPKIDNILRKSQNGFRKNRSTIAKMLTIRRILEGVLAKNLRQYYLSTLPRPLIPFTEGRWNKSYKHTAYQKRPLQQ